MLSITVLFLLSVQGITAVTALTCTDWRGVEIENGLEYEPKEEDPCFKCTCSEGFATMCRSVTCKPSSCKNYILKPGFCCKFECLDEKGDGSEGDGILTNNTSSGGPGDDNAGNTNDNVTTLGLRLIASTVTSFLVLALLLFMVHRLRQKRVMMAMRRYRNSRRERLDDVDADSFAPEFIGIECPPYEDPPPPYTPPKPPTQNLPSEAPPPYEAVDSNQSNNNVAGGSGSNNNTVPYTSSIEHQCRHETGATNHPALPVLDNLRANQNHFYEARQSLPQYPLVHTYSGRDSAERSNDPPRSSSRIRDQELVQIDTRNNRQRVNFFNSLRFESEDPVMGMSTFHPRRSQTRVTNRGRRAASYHGNSRENRSYGGPSDNAAHQSIYGNTLTFDLDLWDETSTATSTSEYPNSSRIHSRNYMMDDSTDSSQQSHFMSSFFGGSLDPEEVSTETSCSSHQTAHNRYGSLPTNSALMQGRPIHTKTMSLNSQENRSSVDNRGCADSRGKSSFRCELDSSQQSGLQSLEEDSKDIDDPSIDCNFSVSNISTDNRNVSSPQTGAQASVTNCLENDSVLAAEDKNRKLEQIFDSQKLRILRLSKLLQSPGDNHLDNGECPHTSAQNDMPRSHSVNSGMSLFSVCSETGEKKLSKMTGHAIGNDAPYPENAYVGRVPLTVFDTEYDAISSVNDSANSNLDLVQNSQMNLDSTDSDTFSHISSKSGDNPAVLNAEHAGTSGTCGRRWMNRDKACQDANDGDFPVSSLHVVQTKEKLVQTDRKMLSKAKSQNKNKTGPLEYRKKKHSEEGSKTSSRSFINGNVRSSHVSRNEAGRDVDSQQYSNFVDELKLLNRNREDRSEISPTQYCKSNSVDVDSCDREHSMSSHRNHSSKEQSRSKSHRVSRSSSQSSHKSSQSSSTCSNGESNLLCPTSASFSKKKMKNSKRAKHRKSYPLEQTNKLNKNVEQVPVIVGMDTGLEICSKGLKDKSPKDSEPRKYSLV